MIKINKKQIADLLKSFVNFLHRSKKTLLLILIVAVTAITLSAAISIWLSRTYNIHVPSIANIKTIGVKAYWDANLENETKQIQWGTIYPGSSANVTLYIQSISNVKTILQNKTANWTFKDSNNTIVSGPSNSTTYMHLDWDYNNATVNPSETVQVTLTLFVDNSPSFIDFLINNNVDSFSFDIIITASETL